MTELQLGLLAIGAVVVAGVFAYNRVQEKRAQREAQRSFASGHDDVLLGGSGSAGEARAPVATHRPELQRERPQPDERIDYVIEIALKAPVAAVAVEEHWQPIQRRHSPRAVLSMDASAPAWKAGLQLVTRAGAVGEAELIEFRAAVETMAAALGGIVAAPEMKAATEQARALDQLCGETDIQVVLHVVAPQGGALSAEAVAEAAEAGGLAADGDGRFVLRTPEGQVLYELVSGDGALSLALDLPHAPDTVRTFESMARLAHHLAAACGGSLVDDNGNALGEQAVAAIAAQLDQVRGVLEARGIAPGSPAAARLFS
jgi:FtsZ-interacting cell division protein ZipA